MGGLSNQEVLVPFKHSERMSHSTHESDDEMLSSDRTDSPSIDEGSSRRGLKRGAGLKKGPWTSAEDAMLRDYVRQHGEGNWNAVQKYSGLSRCGKSCRLRWANHLRPNLKKGAFTADEERVIVELHSKLGNKWARMATKLPGRTDNEIKNYWNTRIKRRQRAGLPLYPADLQVPGENYRTNDSNEFGSGIMQHPDLQTNNFEIPDIVFENLKGSQGVFTCAPLLPDIAFSSMLTRGLGSSQGYNFMPTTMTCPKQLRGTETLFPGFSGSVSNGETPFDQFHGASSEMLSHPSGLSLPYDPHHNRRIPPQFSAMPGSHALLNGNFSASKPIQGAVKLELPSLQYPEPDLGFWDSSPSQPPSLESVDTFIRSPSPTRLYLSDCPSPRNSGLLDALFHEAQTLSSTQNLSSEKSPNSFVASTGDVIDGSNLNLCETAVKEHGDPISPLSHSAESVFSECTPISEHESVNSLPVTNNIPVPVPKKAMENPTKLDLSRPDALLDAGWLGKSDECWNGQSIINDTIASVFGDDLCSNYKQVAGGNSALSQGWMVGPYHSWNNMPSVCQMFEQP